MADLEHLVYAVRRVDPQLPIHAPDVAHEIARARGSRAPVIAKAEIALELLAREEQPSALREVLVDAEHALGEINVATDSLRKFLAETFTF